MILLYPLQITGNGTAPSSTTQLGNRVIPRPSGIADYIFRPQSCVSRFENLWNDFEIVPDALIKTSSRMRDNIKHYFELSRMKQEQFDNKSY